MKKRSLLTLSKDTRLPGPIQKIAQEYIDLTGSYGFEPRYINDAHNKTKAVSLKNGIIEWITDNINVRPFSILLSLIYSPIAKQLNDADKHNYAHFFMTHLFDTILSIHTPDDYFVMSTPSACPDSIIYLATDFKERIQLFSYLEHRGITDDIFVDWGSGPGPIAFQAAVACTLSSIFLVENNNIHVRCAIKNRDSLYGARTQKENIIIIKSDAASVRIPDATIHYFYKPFGWDTMSKVLNNIYNEFLISNKKQTIILNTSNRDDELIILFDTRSWLISKHEDLMPPLYLWHSN